MIAFGPVPSRRLGRSLGINNIPPKNCSYSCIYCQVGRTLQMQVERRAFYEPEEIVADVQEKVARTEMAQEPVDYIAFVPDGEPTLDVHLGREIDLLKPLGIPIAVITNASLVWREDVREDLMAADWVSLKVDAADEQTWRQVSRPHGSLQLASILEGALEFARIYPGTLVTETMLVADINEGNRQIGEVATFLARLQPSTAYVAIPTRPPAEEWARAPDEAALNRAFQILSQKVDRVETLTGYEGDAFAFTGDLEEDLLSITAVHPMREEAVSAFLARAGAGWSVVQRMVAEHELVEVEHTGHTYYLRKLRVPGGDA
jgi:wyosine [tRNA(Phe)-imidazoG37] synthetase (radical SAM superfamily)